MLMVYLLVRQNRSPFVAVIGANNKIGIGKFEVKKTKRNKKSRRKKGRKTGEIRVLPECQDLSETINWILVRQKIVECFRVCSVFTFGFLIVALILDAAGCKKSESRNHDPDPALMAIIVGVLGLVMFIVLLIGVYKEYIVDKKQC